MFQLRELSFDQRLHRAQRHRAGFTHLRTGELRIGFLPDILQAH